MTEKKHYHSLPSEEWQSMQANYERLKREVARLVEIKEPKLTVELKIEDRQLYRSHYFANASVKHKEFGMYGREEFVFDLGGVFDHHYPADTIIGQVQEPLKKALGDFIQHNNLYASKIADDRNWADKVLGEALKYDKSEKQRLAEHRHQLELIRVKHQEQLDKIKAEKEKVLSVDWLTRLLILLRVKKL
jgi:hypothetical protein